MSEVAEFEFRRSLELGYLRSHPLLDPELIGALRNRRRKFFGPSADEVIE